MTSLDPRLADLSLLRLAGLRVKTRHFWPAADRQGSLDRLLREASREAELAQWQEDGVDLGHEGRQLHREMQVGVGGSACQDMAGTWRANRCCQAAALQETFHVFHARSCVALRGVPWRTACKISRIEARRSSQTTSGSSSGAAQTTGAALSRIQSRRLTMVFMGCSFQGRFVATRLLPHHHTSLHQRG